MNSNDTRQNRRERWLHVYGRGPWARRRYAVFFKREKNGFFPRPNGNGNLIQFFPRTRRKRFRRVENENVPDDTERIPAGSHRRLLHRRTPLELGLPENLKSFCSIIERTVARTGYAFHCAWGKPQVRIKVPSWGPTSKLLNETSVQKKKKNTY